MTVVFIIGNLADAEKAKRRGLLFIFIKCGPAFEIAGQGF